MMCSFNYGGFRKFIEMDFSGEPPKIYHFPNMSPLFTASVLRFKLEEVRGGLAIYKDYFAHQDKSLYAEIIKEEEHF